MAIDYNTDILSLFAGSVDPDEPYASVPAVLKDDDTERRILTTAEVVRAHMDTLTSRTEANILHFCITRMIAKIGAGGFIYDVTDPEVIGNVCNPIFDAGDTITLDRDGDVSVVTVSEASSNVTTVAAEITADATTAEVSASRSQNGKLVLFAESTFSVTAGVVADKAGIPIDEFFNKRTTVANAVRDSAVELFVAYQRDETL